MLASFALKRLFPARTRRWPPATPVLPLPRIRIGRIPLPVAEMAVNAFKYCSCLKYLGYLMIAFVLSIVGLSYYAVVVLTWGPLLLHGQDRAFGAFFIIAVFHLLLILLTWSYFMVVFQDPGSVPANWSPISMDNLEEGIPSLQVNSLASGPPNEMETRSASRYCAQCRNGKPPRCHHCSICQRCVLKMDHHCVWVVNCVGAFNYKFFLLFLVYAFLETALDVLVLLPKVIESFWKEMHTSTSAGSITVTIIAFAINFTCSLSLLCFVVMHVSLLLSNTTTIEAFERRNSARWKYDLGRKRNFEQVFGTRRALWFIPMYSKEDINNIPTLQGLKFPVQEEFEP